MTVPRLLHETVTPLRVIPEGELMLLEQFPYELDEPIVQYMNQAVQPLCGFAVFGQIGPHPRLLR